MRFAISLCGCLLVVVAGTLPKILGDEIRTIDFGKDVEPLLRKTCYSCHGVDAQEGGLRLDSRQRAFAGGDRGKAIVKGKASESLLIQLVAGKNEDLGLMPPEGEGTPLTKEQVATLEAWVNQGGAWPDEFADASSTSNHWSFQPVARPTIPDVKDTPWLANGVDTFVLSRLEAEKIAPAPVADRSMQMRRLYLDLLGLPPTPEEVSAYLSDERPDAYSRLVDRVLTSPHYGERWGRHWLDLARYADSDGYEKDRPRPHAWRYRDYVIDALNRDVPYDTFSIEQIAGDMLPDATTEQRVASGFHRNTLHNTEGGTDKEEDRVKKTVDRTNTVGAVWLGMTVGCAQCHSHKYDPFSQREYYSLYGFFNSIDEKDIPAPLDLAAEEHAKKKAAFDLEHSKFTSAIKAYESTRLADAQKTWESTAHETTTKWQTIVGAATSKHGAKFLQQKDDALLVTGTNKVSDVYTIKADVSLSRLSAVRLEVLPHKSLVKDGPGRAENGNFVLTTVKVNVEGHGDVKLARARADFSQNAWDVALAINDNADDGWAIKPQIGKRHVAVFELDKPLSLQGDVKVTITLDQKYKGATHNLGHFRLSVTESTGVIDLDGIPPNVDAALQIAAEKRTDAQRKTIANYYRTIDPQLAELRKAESDHAKRAPKMPDTKAQSIAEVATPRETRVHIRGDFLNKGDVVKVNTPAVLPKIRASKNLDRLDLATWLFAREHPLTSRVTANRMWQRFFGRGIVETVDDFGKQGERPSHPRLLDWLATELQDRDWSLKEFHRLAVSSSTYRQSSAYRTDLEDLDPENVLLARQVRRRVEAEVVRDIALTASGLLDRRVGGPSVRPPQPAEYSALTYANSAKWSTSKGGDAYRRGLYTFFQRTSPYPMLMTFDAPDSTECTAQRSSSNTPLQALTLWNDRAFFECAQRLGKRIVDEIPGSANDADVVKTLVGQRVDRAFQICFARRPNAVERDVVQTLLKKQRAFCAENDEAAKAICGTVASGDKDADAALASWIIVARALLNSDEFVTKE